MPSQTLPDSKPSSIIYLRKSRKSKPKVYPVIDEDGVDRTPRPLDVPSEWTAKERQIKCTSGRLDDQKSLSFIPAVSYDNVYPFKSIYVNSSKESKTSIVYEPVKEEPPPEEPPKKISIVLNETDTIFIANFPSEVAIVDSEEGLKIAEENEMYQYKTEGGGRNRRMVTKAVQTISKLMKKMNDDSKSQVHEEMSFESLHLEDEKSTDSFRMSLDEWQLLKIIRSDKFQDALCIIERLLANNVYDAQQKIFWEIADDYTSFTDDEVLYRYNLHHLWTFGDVNSCRYPVTAMEWNHSHKDLLAVAHGKFYYTDWIQPQLDIWNVKNPEQPERVYKFKIPITSISFSYWSPNILAVAFYNGSIILINISRRDLKIVAETEKLDNLMSGICSGVHFVKTAEKHSEEEFIAIFENGEVLLFKTTATKYLKRQQIMEVGRYNGKLKGIETIRRCTPLSIPPTRFSGALVYCGDPEDETIYYIGSTDGVVHICSRNNLNQHMDMFLAHDGPVLSIRFHPFCTKLFATCGSDMFTRVWIKKVNQPILQYSLRLKPTLDFVFSPTHPTVASSIYGDTIAIWDIQRKTFKAQHICQLPAKAKTTCVSFTENGKCLLVGDTLGKVHVYALQNMPFPPFFPENLMVTVLKDILLYRPEAMAKLIRGLKKTIVRKRMDTVKSAVIPRNLASEKCDKFADY